jgi:multiple sugar transport system permease protein
MLVLAVATFALPFQIWMLLGFFAQIPRSLDESARIDGCSYYKTFWKIVAPAAAPGLAATTIMTFFFSWNELFFAIIMCDSRTKTAPLAVMDFLGYRNFDWGAILAAGVVLMIPTLILGFIFKRYMISGLTAGAVKG